MRYVKSGRAAMVVAFRSAFDCLVAVLRDRVDAAASSCHVGDLSSSKWF